eukprot:183942-Hanusia_phi.AAC.1
MLPYHPNPLPSGCRPARAAEAWKTAAGRSLSGIGGGGPGTHHAALGRPSRPAPLLLKPTPDPAWQWPLAAHCRDRTVLSETELSTSS